MAALQREAVFGPYYFSESNLCRLRCAVRLLEGICPDADSVRILKPALWNELHDRYGAIFHPLGTAAIEPLKTQICGPAPAGAAGDNTGLWSVELRLVGDTTRTPYLSGPFVGRERAEDAALQALGTGRFVAAVVKAFEDEAVRRERALLDVLSRPADEAG